MYYEKSKQLIEQQRNQFQFVCLDDLVPNDHILKKIEKVIDFSFIHDLTRKYYSPDQGRACLDTVTLFKIPLLNYIMGKNSIRATLEEAKVNMAFRWFLNIGLDSQIPNYSTFTQNYKRRYEGTDVFQKIFGVIVTKIIEMGFIDESSIFIDGTHIKANANKHKAIKKRVKEIATTYQKEMEKEIDEYRELNGRDKFFDDNDSDGSNYTVDDETGEIKEKDESKEKEITESTIDPDSGMFVKGEHERIFAYVDQVACDKHGWILGYDVNKGSMHDSKAFLPFFDKLKEQYNIKNVVLDAGYVSAQNAEYVLRHNIDFIAPYVRPKGNEQEFNKKKFDFYIESNSYLCPNNKELIPWNITKDGYIEYKISKLECGNCPNKKSCLKNYNFKTIRRHLYEDCLEKAKEIRLSEKGKELYSLRKLTIERVFAEGKEKHGLRYTRYKSRQKNFDMRALLYACLNMKKLGNLINEFPSYMKKVKQVWG